MKTFLSLVTSALMLISLSFDAKAANLRKEVQKKPQSKYSDNGPSSKKKFTFKIKEVEASGDNLRSYWRPNFRSESVVAVNPLNSKNVVIIANDGSQEPQPIPPTGGSSTAFHQPWLNIDGVYTSFNKGEVWSRQVLHWELGNPALVYRADPGIAVGPKLDDKGHFTYANGARFYLQADGSVFNDAFNYSIPFMCVVHSDNNGVAWTLPTIISAGGPPSILNDKPAIHVDNNPSSPFFGYVYSAWLVVDAVSGVTLGTGFTRSIDGGITFAPQQTLVNPNLFNPILSPGAMTSLPDGTLFLTVTEFDIDYFNSTGINRDIIYITKSIDGGQSFEPFTELARPLECPVRNVNGNNQTVPGGSFDVAPDAFSISNKDGKIFIVWPNWVEDHLTLQMAVSEDKGKTWKLGTVVDNKKINAFFPALATFKDQVMLGFQASKNVPVSTPAVAGATTIDSFFVFSYDKGKKFTKEIRLSSKSGDPAGTALLGTFIIEGMGDYNGADAGPDGTFWYTWTDARSAKTCQAVDQYRVEGAVAPNLQDSCSPDFGRTSIFAASIQVGDCHLKTKKVKLAPIATIKSSDNPSDPKTATTAKKNGNHKKRLINRLERR